MRNVTDFFRGEEEYPDLDVAGAVERLSRAIQCRTVNFSAPSQTDFSEFDRLHDLMRRSFPHLMERGTFELIGPHGPDKDAHAVLITIPGTDPSPAPCLYMAHQDVVPVVEGTEADWTHGPFSGDVADGYIWGRGTLDIKQMLFGILEAAEYLLAHDMAFRRTAYLAFGDDEETLQLGAANIAAELKRRGVKLEFVLDEGDGTIESGDVFGAPEVSISQVALMEKGYADLELSVESRGGHSSRPFGGTSLSRLARAITAIEDHPFEARLPGALREAFRALSPHITEEPLHTLTRDVDGNSAAIAAFCLSRPELFPFVTTTIAPTMIEGGSAACNVMPQNMRAVINFRINEGDTADAVLEHCRACVPEGVNLRFLQANAPSATARQGLGFALLKESMAAFYPEALLIPSLTVGATDAHCYEEVCDACLRCSPFLANVEEVHSGVHGTNERLSVRAYAQGIRVMIRLMERANVSPRTAAGGSGA